MHRAATRVTTRRAGLAATVPLLSVLLTSTLALVSCSGPQEPQPSPAQTLAAAKRKLDRTSGVQLRLRTDRLPAGVTGLLAAEGVGTHDPAFRGDIKVLAAGVAADAKVVATGGAVYAILPFGTSYVRLDPADYGAPDPAALLDPDRGLPSLLTSARGPKEGRRTRHGEEVLRTITGTVPGRAVARVIPSARAGTRFEATFAVTDADRLRRAVLTGPFYPGSGEVTYTVDFDRYGVHPHITAP